MIKVSIPDQSPKTLSTIKRWADFRRARGPARFRPVVFFLFQEWSHPDPIFFTHCTNMKYTIKVSFRADIFGTFRQSVIFSFGFEPHLRQDLCVDVVPVLDEDETKIQQLQETLIKQAERYSTLTTQIPDTQLPKTSDYRTFLCPVFRWPECLSK